MYTHETFLISFDELNVFRFKTSKYIHNYYTYITYFSTLALFV